MRLFLSLFLLSLMALGLSSCSGGVKERNTQQQYQQLDPGLVREVQALGNRNWIVIADQSFPNHSRRGVRTLMADKEIPEVISGVLDVIDIQQHVTPIFYRTRQLSEMTNETTPGIDAYRKALTQSLRGYKMRDFQSRYLNAILEEDSKTFAVLVIKTKTELPFSSIFIELDSGYWDPNAERELRAKMQAQDPGGS